MADSITTTTISDDESLDGNEQRRRKVSVRINLRGILYYRMNVQLFRLR